MHITCNCYPQLSIRVILIQPHFTQLQVEDNQMMVDKTGVGPGGGSDPPVKSEASSNAESRDPQPPPSQPEIRINVPTKKPEEVRVPSEKSQR